MKSNGNGNGILPWIKDEARPELRTWEQFYRNRWQHDKIIRSTHGVNCTGGCTWQIYVKDGIVTWEMQGLDYPTPGGRSSSLRAARLPARHFVLLVFVQPAARALSLHAWRTDRPLEGSPVEA